MEGTDSDKFRRLPEGQRHMLGIAHYQRGIGLFKPIDHRGDLLAGANDGKTRTTGAGTERRADIIMILMGIRTRRYTAQ